MQEQGQEYYLTVAEQEALKNNALRQQALAIRAFLAVAILSSTPSEVIEQKVAGIRMLDKDAAKKLRTDLVVARKALESIVGLGDSGNTLPVITEEPVVEAAVEIVVPPASEAAILLAPQSDGAIDDRGEPLDINYEWAQKALGADYHKHAGKSVEELAQAIYEAAGSPKARTQYRGDRTYKVDYIARITQRLLGLDTMTIAQQDGVSQMTVCQWFISLERRIASATPVPGLSPTASIGSREERDASALEWSERRGEILTDIEGLDATAQTALGSYIFCNAYGSYTPRSDVEDLETVLKDLHLQFIRRPDLKDILTPLQYGALAMLVVDPQHKNTPAHISSEKLGVPVQTAADAQEFEETILVALEELLKAAK